MSKIVSVESGLSLTQREGPRPETTQHAPHSQLNQRPGASLSRELIERLAALPDVVVGTSLRAPPGTVGLHLTAEQARDDERAFLIGHEFAHVHSDDGALHLILPEPLRTCAVEAGWAEAHPCAGRPTISPDTVMVYAPRNEAEVETVASLAEASWRDAHR